MPRPAPIRDALHFPATAATILFAVVATVAWWAKVDCSALLADAHVARGQLHRLLTAALLHRDPIHLIFNLYWLWTLGPLIERHLGTWRSALLFAALAAGSNAAEFTLLSGPVGLSGVVFGLFGFLCIGAPDTITARTRHCFLAWFVLCIALTLTRLLPAANIAHATGFLVGGAIARSQTWPTRSLARLAPTGVTLALLCAAVFFRPYINLAPTRGEQEARLGYEALRASDDRAAARWLRDATTLNPRIAAWWFNRAVAEARLADHDAAMISYNHACRLEPANPNFRTARDALQDYLAGLSRQPSQHASVSAQ